MFSKILSNIVSWYRDTIEDTSMLFMAETYQSRFGLSDRFPSLLSKVFRFLLKYLYIVFPIVWIVAFIIGLGEDIPFIGKVITSPLAAVLYCIVIAVAFLVLMLIESFSKIMTSLILCKQLPQGAENPPDAILMSLVKSRNERK